MLKFRKPLLPEWRYWPAFPFAALIFVAWFGLSSSAPTQAVAQPQAACHQQQKPCTSENNNPPFFFEMLDSASRNHDAIEALSGVAAVIVAIGLAIVTSFLWRATRELAISTADLATGAADQVIETRAATLVARQQLELTALNHDLAIKSHKVNWHKFHTEHRPKIEIRSIGIKPQNGKEMFAHGDPIVGSLVIVNTGGAAAQILEATYRFFRSEFGLPMVPPLESGSSQLLAGLPQTVEGHGSCLVRIESEVFPDRDLDNISVDRLWLYVIGAVRFADMLGNESWMHFCREFKRKEGCEGAFRPVENPDYEYND